jgi:hypothetical protein
VKITHPDKGFSGPLVVGALSLDFRDGVAHADVLNPVLHSYLQVGGYGVENVPAPRPAHPSGPVDTGWSVKELTAFAYENGIDLAGASRKADIVAAIGAASQAAEPGPETGSLVDLTTTPDPA